MCGIKSVELINNDWFDNVIATFANGHVAEFTKLKSATAWGHAGTDNWPATVALAEAIGEDEDKLWDWLNDAINEEIVTAMEYGLRDYFTFI